MKTSEQTIKLSGAILSAIGKARGKAQPKPQLRQRREDLDPVLVSKIEREAAADERKKVLARHHARDLVAKAFTGLQG